MNEDKVKAANKVSLALTGLFLLTALGITSVLTIELIIEANMFELAYQRFLPLDFVESRMDWVAAWLALWLAFFSAILAIFGLRRALFWGGLSATALSAAAWGASFWRLFEILYSFEHWIMGLAAWSGLLMYQFARLQTVWSKLKPALQNTGQLSAKLALRKERGFREHFVYLSLSLGALIATASQLVWTDLALMQRYANDGNLLPSIGFACLVGSAFLPLGSAIWLHERHLSLRDQSSFWRDDVITPFFLGLLLVGVTSVSTLAFFAARYATSGISAAISYATFICVLSLFIFVILLPHVLAYFQRRSEIQISASSFPAPVTAGIASLEAPAKWLSHFDTLLVKIVAPLSGGTQALFAHVHVVAILSMLSMLGLIIPRPFGIVPIVIGIALAVSLGRRWAWIEEDRETASRLERTSGPNIRLGFENDLKDEALLGYAGLFILVPLTLYQLQDITSFVPPLDERRGILLTWVAFFGGELAKAVPFVDWWDIYGNEDLSSTGKHLTFISRAAVDLVILAALFQALSIWQRNRVQSRLYEDGHLDSFDPFKEQEFFERGIVRLKGELPENDLSGARLRKAEQFAANIEQLRRQKRLATATLQGGERGFFMVQEDMEARVQKHVRNRRALLNQSTRVFETAAPYSNRRLSELIKSQNCDLRAGANWMVQRWDVLVGDPVQQLFQLGRRWESIDFPSNAVGDDEASKRRRRVQKSDFERILVELAHPDWIDLLLREELGVLVNCLKRVSDNVEFEFSRILAFEVFGRLRTVYSVMFLSKFVLSEDMLKENERWRHKIITHAEGPDYSFVLGRSDMRQRVYDALHRIGCNPRSGNGAKLRSLELLEWMANADRAKDARDHARQLSERLTSRLEELSLFEDG